MAKLAVIYDFHEDGIKPFSMVVRFAAGELDWNRMVFYIPLEAPFERLMADELEDSGIPGITVLLEDLVVNPRHPRTVGISISSIAVRHKDSLLSLADEVQLVIRMCDIEEVLNMDIREFVLYPFND